jgi:hypothetical protein
MAAEMVHKVTLSTGKVVLFRDPKIKHQELAAREVGNRHSEAPLALNIAMQNALLKILIVTVDGQPFKAHDDLDSILTLGEYNQCLRVLLKLTGGEGEAAPLIESVSSGEQSRG